ncbi:hypothetical protein HanRHA438_Chr13g0607911 [Helianthus annuus]|nr:hypothetical protein HanIR_Chr13g0649801 [Helianthus annuus]KAJ0859039.1 hypothetical protein HanRHA438_Chr13g0607911 [Helianthus annuus]
MLLYNIFLRTVFLEVSILLTLVALDLTYVCLVSSKIPPILRPFTSGSIRRSFILSALPVFIVSPVSARLVEPATPAVSELSSSARVVVVMCKHQLVLTFSWASFLLLKSFFERF